MSVAFSCEVCHYGRDVPDDYAGRKIRCPRCSATIDLAPPPGDGQAPSAAPPSDTHPCPFCAEPIKIEARKCRWCGEIVDRKLAIAKQQEKLKEAERRRELLVKDAPNAKGSVILGIIAILTPLFPIGFLLGPIAIVMGLNAKKAIKKEPRLEGGGMATAGITLGAVAIGATILTLLMGATLLGT